MLQKIQKGRKKEERMGEKEREREREREKERKGKREREREREREGGRERRKGKEREREREREGGRERKERKNSSLFKQMFGYCSVHCTQWVVQEIYISLVVDSPSKVNSGLLPST